MFYLNTICCLKRGNCLKILFEAEFKSVCYFLQQIYHTLKYSVSQTIRGRIFWVIASKLNSVTVSIGGYGLIRSVSLWTASERHGNEVTPMEIQQPAELPCLSVSASNGRVKKGRSSRFVLLSPSPPCSLCLGFIWPTGGCMQTGAGCL